MITRYMRIFSFFFLAIFSLVTFPCVEAISFPAKPSGYVTDTASVLTPDQKSFLEGKLAAFNASTSNEIAVVIVKSLEGDYIEHYAVELFKAYGIGTKKNDNGVLLLVAIDDHKMRIEVGYGLEGSLTDSISSAIIRDDLTPAFKQNDFYRGIDKAVDSIIKVTQGEYVASTSSKSDSGGGFSFETIVIILVVGVQFLSSILSRSKSWWAGGVLGGLIGGAFTFFGFLGISLLVGGIMTVVLVLLGLLFDYIVSNKYSQAVSSGSSIPWWAGGSSRGGGFGGGSSFGGFGGGRSGGGGSSGSW